MKSEIGYGVMGTELIRENVAELREHLRTVSRRALAQQDPGTRK